jgi:hypothetical protein
MKLPKPLPFIIMAHHRKNAKALGVEIQLSTVKGKKLDVFKGGKKVASIGAKGMWDYALYKEAEKAGVFPKGYANKRRELYRMRHDGEQHKEGSAGYYSWFILW